MATQLKIQGNHIQHILEKILGLQVGGFYTGTRQKEDAYVTYVLSKGAITTEDDDRINIYYYWDYRIIVKNNLLMFPIINGCIINNVMKVLTDEEQYNILKYLGINE